MASSIVTIPQVRLSRARRREAMVGLAFVTPVVLGYLVFNVGPIIASLVLSFTDYNILNPSPRWVGLNNLSKAFGERLFYTALGNTLYYTALRIPLSIALAFVLAVMVKRATLASRLYRSAIYVPSIVPSVGAAIVWIVIFTVVYLLSGAS